MEPVVLALERKYGDKIDFIVADADKEQALGQRYQIYYIPAFFLIDKNGAVYANKVGVTSQQEMEQLLDKLLDQ